MYRFVSVHHPKRGGINLTIENHIANWRQGTITLMADRDTDTENNEGH